MTLPGALSGGERRDDAHARRRARLFLLGMDLDRPRPAQRLGAYDQRSAGRAACRRAAAGDDDQIDATAQEGERFGLFDNSHCPSLSAAPGTPCSLSAGEDAGSSRGQESCCPGGGVRFRCKVDRCLMCGDRKRALPLREDELRRTAPIGRDCIRGDQADQLSILRYGDRWALLLRLKRDRAYTESDQPPPTSASRVLSTQSRMPPKAIRKNCTSPMRPVVHSPSRDATYLATVSIQSSPCPMTTRG